MTSWSGFYIGSNIGYGWGRSAITENSSPSLGLTDALNSSGAFGGLQTGYNFRFGLQLIGIEGNFDWSGAKTSGCFTPGPQTCSADPRWVAAITGRVGQILGPALLYLKGGAAWAHTSYSDVQFPGTSDPVLPAETTRFGWTAGAGFEYMFLSNWSAKIEYNYYGFPAKSVWFQDEAENSYTKTIKQNMQMVTVGINYHFGVVSPAAAPVSQLTKNSSVDDTETVSRVHGFWGVDVSRLGVSSWAGALIAPRGDLEKSGLRVWVFGEAGRYKFSDSGEVFKGNFQSGDMLVGYGFESENYSINLLAGVNAINHTVTPFDSTNPVQGTRAGFKVRGDAYWTPTAQTMTYGEYEYSTAFRTYWILQKVGVDISGGKEIYVGPQVMFLGDQQHNQWRVGGHLTNLKFGNVRVNVSTGYARDSLVGGGAYGYLEMSRDF